MRLFTPLLRNMVHRALSAEGLGTVQIDAAFEDALRGYRMAPVRMPLEPSAAGRLTVRLAALTASFYKTLLHREFPPAEARRLTALVTGYVYERITAIPTAASHLLRSGTAERVSLTLQLMRTFGFGPPAFDMRDVEEPGTIGFDVRRCPIADYFQDQELEELCVESWCNLDYEMAQRWGAKLDRTTTLARGADHCDFRFRVEENA